MQRIIFCMQTYILLLCFIMSPLFSQQNSWQPANGPYGGTIRALAINSTDYIFVGTAGGGVFRSGNGENWEAVNNGITNYIVRALVISGNDDIFAGTFAGVFRSTNNGESWSQINTGLNSSLIYALTIDDKGNILAGGIDGLFRSTNNGDSWNALNTEFGSGVRALFTFGDSLLFAGTVLHGAFRSTDNGESWDEINDGLHDAAINTFFILDGAPGNNNTRLNQSDSPLLVEPVTLVTGTDGGASFSNDLGDSWTSIKDLDFIGVNDFAPIDNSDILAATALGIYISKDEITTWTHTSLETYSYVLGAGLNGLYTGTQYKGIAHSGDNGETWLPANNGLNAADINAITKSAGNILAGTSNGYYVEDDKREWKAVDILDGYVQTVDVTPAGDMLVSINSDVFRLNSDGENASNITFNLPAFGTINGFAFDANGNTYAAGSDGVFLLDEANTIWLEKNFGSTNLYSNDIEFDFSGNFLWKVGFDYISRSEDGGDTWEDHDNGLPDFTNIYAIRAFSGRLMIGTAVGLYEYNYDDETWLEFGAGWPQNTSAFDFEPIDPFRILTATSRGPFVFSSGIWNTYYKGLANRPVNEVAADEKGNALAGLSGGGLWQIKLDLPCDCPVDCLSRPSFFGKVSNAEARRNGSPLQVDDTLDVDLFRRFRDGVLNTTSQGQQIVDNYYDNAFEILITIIFSDTNLTDHAMAMTKMLQTPIRNFLEGDGSMLVTESLVDTTDAFISILSAAASDSLLSDIESSLAAIGPLDNLKNIAVSEAIRIIIGDTISTGIVYDMNRGIADFSLAQNYPNPFNSSTTIEFALPQTEYVVLKIYNHLGQKIATLIDQSMKAGIHRVVYDSTEMASGVYFYRIEAGRYKTVRKMLLLK